MAFAVPASQKSIGQNQFEFTLPDDPKRVYSVPLMKFIRPAIIMRADTMTELALAQTLFDEYLPEAFERLEDSDQLQALMAAWQEASGIGTGESPASSS